MHPHRMLFLTVTLLVGAADLGCCVKVEFFSEPDYSGLLEKKIVNEAEEKTCNRLENYHNISSIRTDKCLIIYGNKDCDLGYYSIRIPSSTPHFDKEEAYTWFKIYDFSNTRRVQSFHVCSQELGGGPKLDVDLFDATFYSRSHLLQSWRDVCKCETVPSPIVKKEGRQLSINNHGNNMYIYEEENCRGTSRLIPAGDSDIARFLQHSGPPDVIRSFRPADSSDCIKLDASIYKFTFSNGSDSLPKTEDIQLATTRILINEGELPMSHTLEFSDTIGDSNAYTVANAFTQVHSAGVRVGVSTESNAGVPLVAGAKLKLSLEDNYQYTNTRDTSNTNTKTATESKMIKISSAINVASCEKCYVSGFVKIVRDFPISYVAEATLRGSTDDEQLSAEELKIYIPAGMTYVREYDEHNVVVAVEGSMTAEFAWETYVSKKCEPVTGCKRPSQSAARDSPKPTNETLQVPFIEYLVN